MRLFDTHAHMSHRAMNVVRDDVLNRWAPNALINPAIRYEDNWTMREKLAERENVWFAAGIHPNAVAQLRPNQDEVCLAHLRAFAAEDRTIAIGETGLDLHYAGADPIRQELWFRRQIELSLAVRKPLILHIRDAHDKAVEILHEYSLGGRPGVAHCFCGSRQQARELLSMGLMLGIGAAVTYADAEELRLAVAEAPLELLLLETDAPYVRPAGWTGPNTPFSLPLVAETIARIRSMTADDVAEATWRNACRLFAVQIAGT